MVNTLIYSDYLKLPDGQVPNKSSCLSAITSIEVSKVSKQFVWWCAIKSNSQKTSLCLEAITKVNRSIECTVSTMKLNVDTMSRYGRSSVSHLTNFLLQLLSMTEYCACMEVYHLTWMILKSLINCKDQWMFQTKDFYLIWFGLILKLISKDGVIMTEVSHMSLVKTLSKSLIGDINSI